MDPTRQGIREWLTQAWFRPEIAFLICSYGFPLKSIHSRLLHATRKSYEFWEIISIDELRDQYVLQEIRKAESRQGNYTVLRPSSILIDRILKIDIDDLHEELTFDAWSDYIRDMYYHNFPRVKRKVRR